MSHATQTTEHADLQRTASTFFAAAFSPQGAEALLSAQAEFLQRMGSAMNDWMHRRHEAVVDAQRVVARMRDTSDVSEIFKAQQEWIAGEFERLSADAAACQSMAHTFMKAGVAGAAEVPATSVAETVHRMSEEAKAGGGRATKAHAA